MSDLIKLCTVTKDDVPPNSKLGQEFAQMSDDNTEPESDPFSSFLYYREDIEEAFKFAESLASFDFPVYVYEWPKHKIFAIAKGSPAKDAQKRGMRIIRQFN
jgi:hypothetical protein